MLVNSNMTTIDKAKPLVPFLFMGCWNEDDSPRVSVAKAIMKNPIETLVLGGDNVYPQKLRIGNATDFTRVYSQKTLMNGVHMLHGKDIYAALGNHNVGGPMLKLQSSLTEWTMPNRYYSVNFTDYSLVVIDSNLIDDAETFDNMNKWLLETINKLKVERRKYYYVQHDPFISFGKKKITVFPKLTEILGVLANYPPIAILCADTHNYQKGTLKIGDVIIQQYVVGTGGAHPDYAKGKNGDSHTTMDITYTMESHIPGYGYLEIKPESTKFIKVENWRPFEGKAGKHSENKIYRKTYKFIHRRNKKSKKRIRK